LQKCIDIVNFAKYNNGIVNKEGNNDKPTQRKRGSKMEEKQIEEAKAARKEILNTLFRYEYWFANEMIKYEQEDADFTEKCKESEKRAVNGESIEILVSTASNNARVMKGCLKETTLAIRYLKDEENAEYIEMWQLAAIQALLDRCKKDKVIPFDMPATVMVILGMWDELKLQ